MNLVSTDIGQVVQLFSLDEIRPATRGIYTPNLFDSLATRYGFLAKPDNISEALKLGAKFQQGRININGDEIAVGELSLYNDGVIVTTRNTKDSNAVLDEFLHWVTTSFTLREPQTKIPRTFFSSVVVDFESDLDLAFLDFERSMRHYNRLLKSLYGWDLPVMASRVTFNIDPMTLPPQRHANFIIERRGGVPYEANRYFSSAPLPTDAHLELLEIFERELIGPPD